MMFALVTRVMWFDSALEHQIMQNLHQGSLAEIKAIEWFTRRNYFIYKSFYGYEPVDFIVEKDKKLSKVSVKSTTQRTPYNTGWICGIKSVRANKFSNNIVNFDSTDIDYLCVHLVALDKLIVYNAKLLTVKTAITVLDKDINALEAFNG